MGLDNEMRTIMVSGGMDPIHVGHLRMIQAAAKLGRVVVALNSDDWLMRKKGYIFMTWEERAEILRGIKGVHEVVAVDDSDGTVCEALRRVQPKMFGNGGDRKVHNTPEQDVCKEFAIDLVWGLGGGKVQSSSELVETARSDGADV